MRCYVTVYNRSLFNILLKLKWNKSVYELVGLLKHGISSKLNLANLRWIPVPVLQNGPLKSFN